VLPTHDPADAVSDQEQEAQANNHNGGAPRAYTSVEGIRIHCAYDEIVDVDSLVAHPLNPNVHPASQIELLAKIISGTGKLEEGSTDDDKRHADGGYREALTLSRRSGFIIKGHGRRGAALRIKQQTGETAVPIIWQDYASEAEEYADMVADNRIAELSSLDVKQVGELLAQVANDFPDFDATMFAFSETEIAAFGSGWAPTRDPRAAGSTSAEGRATIKVLVPSARKDEAEAAIKAAIANIEGATVE
jgi:hypothetical protein